VHERVGVRPMLLLTAVAAAGLSVCPLLAQTAVPPTGPPVAAPAAAAPAGSGAAPTTATSPATANSLASLDPIAVLRAPGSTALQRDEAARRLIIRKTPESKAALAAALADGGNRQGQVAAARAIALDPDPDPSYVIPLSEMIGAAPVLADAARTEAAIAALACYRNAPDVQNRLIDLAVAHQGAQQQIEQTRIAALRAVGTMADKRAAQALVQIVGNDAEPPAIRTAAAQALADMTVTTSNLRDPSQWQKWWAENQRKDDATFERDILQARSAQLTRVGQRNARVVAEAQALLAEAYQAAPEKSKEALLLRYLRSPEPEMRAVGALAVKEDFAQTRTPSPAVKDQLRMMVGDSSPQVRVLVATTLFYLNDDQAFDALLQQLANEPDADVRIALAQALVPMRDVRVVPSLLKLLHDPSPAVAEVAARGLGDPSDPNNLSPLILKDPNLSVQVATELQEVLAERTRSGTAPVSLRAALVDAMGSLKNPDLGKVFTDLLKGNQPVPIRVAALRALGQLGKPGGQTWPAQIIIDSLSDPDEAVRLEAVRALKTTADFSSAENLYNLMRQPSTSPNLRDEAWGVLRNLFADDTATLAGLQTFADQRFANDPERRIEILQAEARRLTATKDLGTLASVQQNIGAELLKLAAKSADDPAQTIKYAEEADKYFLPALNYYLDRNPRDPDMVTSALTDQHIDALLIARKYDEAARFGAARIGANNSNQEMIGTKLKKEVDRLHSSGHDDDAMRLIDAIHKMNPPLAPLFDDAIRRIEQEVRHSLATPRSAGDTGKDAVGAGQ
jgi:HEAT repeat protein